MTCYFMSIDRFVLVSHSKHMCSSCIMLFLGNPPVKRKNMNKMLGGKLLYVLRSLLKGDPHYPLVLSKGQCNHFADVCYRVYCDVWGMTFDYLHTCISTALT